MLIIGWVGFQKMTPISDRLFKLVPRFETNAIGNESVPKIIINNTINLYF